METKRHVSYYHDLEQERSKSTFGRATEDSGAKWGQITFFSGQTKIVLNIHYWTYAYS